MFNNAMSFNMKTFRFNNQQNMDKKVTDFVNNLGSNVSYNVQTSSFSVPFFDLPQNIDQHQKNKLSNTDKDSNYIANKSFFQVNKMMQPIQFVATITWERK